MGRTAGIQAHPTLAEAPAGPNSLGRDIGLLAGVRLASVGAGFLTSVLVARTLGPPALGAAAVGLTIGTIAALLANGGLNISSIYYLGRRPAERGPITNRSFSLGLVATALAALIVVIAGRVLSPATFDGGAADLAIAAAFLAASIVAFELAGSLLLGHDRRTAYLATQAIEGMGSLFLIGLLFALGATTSAGYVAGAALAAMIAAVFATGVVARAIGGLRLSFDAGFTREALSLGLRGQVGNILQMLNLRLDLLLVPLFVDLRAAGIYLIAVRMSEVIAQIASSGAAYLFPAVSRLDLKQTDLTERTVRLTLIVVVGIGLVIGVFAPLLLGVFFGPAYIEGTGALRITIIAMVPLSLQRLMGSDMKGRGHAGLVSISAGAALIATVALDVLLIPALGIEGASLASLIAYSTGAAVLLIAYRRVTGSSLLALVPRVEDARQLAAASLQLLRGQAR